MVGLAKKQKDTQIFLSVGETVRKYMRAFRVARNGTLILLKDVLERGYFRKIVVESRRPGWESADSESRKKNLTIIFDIRATNEAVTGSRGGIVPQRRAKGRG